VNHYQMSQDFIAALARMQKARATRRPVLNRQIDEYAASSAPTQPEPSA
jgi:hypothetical protein